MQKKYLILVQKMFLNLHRRLNKSFLIWIDFEKYKKSTLATDQDQYFHNAYGFSATIT